ncbi:MAG: MarR family transcriptional regulator [Eggerthellaceae bacterium]|nr:MarR family transcriptional regulator [Eggerthellaceae bacterium]
MSPAPLSPASDDLTLDSTYLLGFEMAHRALREGLASLSSLNVTQYRVLTKLLQAPGPVNQGELGRLLALKPNVVTQAADALQQEGYVSRSTGDADGRTRFLSITDAGRAHVQAVNEALIASLYATFPTEDPTYRTILEAAIAAGSRIEPPLDGGQPPRYPATRALVAVELVRQETERTLRDVCGASFSECRMVQRLAEVGHPVRVGTLGESLMLSPVNAARATDRLVKRGWARRLRSPEDRKAVYVALTDEGAFQGDVIGATVNELARTRLWANLAAEHRAAIQQMGHIVMADLQRRKAAQERELLGQLQPA